MTGLIGLSSKRGDATGGDEFSVLGCGCPAIDECIAGGEASETDGIETGLKPKVYKMKHVMY
jgi:hypothetical protein